MTQYLCQSCNMSKPVSYKAIAAHLKRAHGIDIKQEVCQEQLLSHIDLTDSYSSTYQYTFKSGVEIIKTETRKRDPEDILFMEVEA